MAKPTVDTLDKDLKDLKSTTDQVIKDLQTAPRFIEPMVMTVHMPRMARDGHPLFKKEKR